MKNLQIFDMDNDHMYGTLMLVEDGSLSEQLKNLSLDKKGYCYAGEFKNLVLEPFAPWNQLVVQFICSLDPEFLIFISESQ